MGKSRVKGIVIEIGGDTTGLDKALKGTNDQIRNTQSNLKDVERLLKLDPTNTNLLEQKQRLLAEAISETEEKLQALNTASDQHKDTVKNYDAWKAAFDPIQEEIDTTKKKLKELKEQQAKMEDAGEVNTDAYKQLTEEISTTSDHLKDLKEQVKKVGEEFGNPISQEQFDSLQREIAETNISLQKLKAEASDTGIAEELKNVQNELTQVNRLLKLDPTNLTLLEQKQELLTSAIETTKKSIQATEEAYEKMCGEAENGIPKNSKAFRELERQIEESKMSLSSLTEEMKSTENALYGIDDTPIDAVTEALENAAQKCDNLERELDTVNDSLNFDPSSIKLLTQKQEVLRDSIEATTQKLKLLEDQQNKISREYASGDIDRGAYLEFQNKVAKTKSKLKELEESAEKNLQKIADSTDPAEKGIREIGDAVDDVKEKASGFGDLLQAEFVVEGASRILDALKDISEETEEYRKIMGSLEVSSEAAGYTAEQTSEAYKKLYGILDDDQSAATALANLQALELPQETLLKLIDSTIGAWAKYGDSIPIEGLAEAINETAKSGQVTGTFADVLNWGTQELFTYNLQLKDTTQLQAMYDKAMEEDSNVKEEQIKQLEEELNATKEWNNALENCTTAEDYFNLALQQCTTEQQRLQLILQVMNEQDLATMAEKWRENNASMVEANESSADMQEQLALIGEKIEPLMTKITDSVVKVLEWFNSLDSGAQNFVLATIVIIAALGQVGNSVVKTSDLIKKLSELDLPSLSSAFGTITGKVLPGVQNTFSTVFSFIASNPVVLLITAIVGLVALIATKGDEIKEILNGIDEFLQVIFVTDWTEIFGPVLGGILNGFFSIVKDVWDGIKQILDGIIDFIRGVFTGDWERAWKGVVSIFEGLFNGLEAIAKAPINAIIGLLNGAIEGFNTLIRGANKIPGVNISTIGKIPYLANGGEVLRGSAIVGEAGPELLTVLGDRTVVQPLTNNTTNHATHLGGVNINVYATAGQDVRELAEIVAEEIQQAYSREEAALA